MMMTLTAIIKSDLMVMMIVVVGTAKVCLQLKPFF